jgi:hypothetical protein
MRTDPPGRTIGAILKARRAADARLGIHFDALSPASRVAGIALAAWADEHARPIQPGDCLRFAKFFDVRPEVVLALGGWVHSEHQPRRGTLYINVRAGETGVGEVDPNDAELAHALAVFGAVHAVNYARVRARNGGKRS